MNKNIVQKVVLCILFPILVGNFNTLLAQDYSWWKNGTYVEGIQSPKDFLGYELGDYLTDHHQMEAYVKHLAEHSERVHFYSYGQSNERRKMYTVVFASPENQGRLQELRRENLRLTDPRTLSESEAKQVSKSQPVFIWLNFANDGGETSAFETGLLMMYQLAAGNDAETKRILENAVVIINPDFNPDSHQRFVTWMKSSTMGAGVADPNASEHQGEWFIWSDGNHYNIDLNRDAFALTQKEARLNAAELHLWNPQIWIDNHGQPNEYYFAPFARPANLNYPESLLKWATEIGKETARAFDEKGWTYVKRETFDLYYPGYWDSYPAFTGAISATYEANGGGNKSYFYRRPDGTNATLREAIHYHFTANMATLKAGVDHKEGILFDYYQFFASGMKEAQRQDLKQIVLPPQEDSERLKDLLVLLERHQIEFYRTTENQSSKKSYTYFDKKRSSRQIPENSIVIPLNQPRKRFIQTMFESDPKMEDAFLQEVKERGLRDSKLGARNRKEGSGFYDVTAWALPILYGLNAILLEDELKALEAVGAEFIKSPEWRGKAGYAYAFSARTNAGMALAGNLLQEGYAVALALKSFSVEGKTFSKGTFLARVERNPASLEKRIRALAEAFSTNVQPISAAWANEGISLGSRYVVNLKKPRILVATKQPTSTTAYGAVYFTLHQRYGLEFVPVQANQLRDINLFDYDVVVFPDGSAKAYADLFSSQFLDTFKTWLRQGGTFVGLKGGAEFATLDGIDLVDSEFVRTTGEEKGRIPIAYLPGSFFKAEVNNDYYLGVAYTENEIGVQVRGNAYMTATSLGANVLSFPENAHLMGHKWPLTEAQLYQKSAVVDVPFGEGNVILFSEDPTFRAYFQGLERLFIGSILFPSGF